MTISSLDEGGRNNPKLVSADRAGVPVNRTDSLDVRHLLLLIYEHRWFVLKIGALVFLVVVGLSLAAQMDFRSTSRLYLGELDNQKGAAAGSDFELSAKTEGELGSEIEIIRSRSLLTQAIRKSGINVTVTPLPRSTPRYWKWLLSRRDPALLDRGVREVRAVNSSLANDIRDAQTYTVVFTSDDEFRLEYAGRRAVHGRLNEPLKSGGLELTLTRGTTGKPKKGSRYELSIEPLEDVLDRVSKKLEVEAPKATPGSRINVLTLSFTTASPRLAASFLEELMHAYLKERQAWKTEDATAAETFVASQLQNLRQSLDGVQKKLVDYRTNNRVVVLDNEAKALIEQVAKFEEQRVAARLQVAALADAKRALSAENPPIGAFLLGEANDPVLENMSASLTAARQKLTDLETRFNEAAPDVKEQQTQVQAQLDSIRSYVGSRYERAQENLGALSGVIAQYEGKLKTVPGAELGLAQLSRESEVYSRTYSYLLERQQQAAIVKASRLSKNRILDPPQVPVREASPKLVFRLASGLVGLLIGAAIVILRAFGSGRLQTEQEVSRITGDRLLVGRVPRRGRRMQDAVADTETLFDAAVAGRDREFIESFRGLRSALYAGIPVSRDGGSVLVVTSPSRGDGKTTVSFWLASVLAADGRKVLLVDANLREDSAVVDSEEPYEKGLRGVLLGECSWRDALGRVSLASGEHYSIAAGGKLRAEALSGEAMAGFLREVRAAFDFVVVDAPSFPYVSDALVLAGSCDAVLSVLRIQNSERKTSIEHVGRLSRTGARYGVVINHAGLNGRHASAKFRPTLPGTPRWRRLSASKRSAARRKAWWIAAVISLAFTGLLFMSGPRFTGPLRSSLQLGASMSEQRAPVQAAAGPHRGPSAPSEHHQ